MSLEQTQLLKHVLVASMAADGFEPMRVLRRCSTGDMQSVASHVLNQLRTFGVPPLTIKPMPNLRERAGKIRQEVHKFYDKPNEAFEVTRASLYAHFPHYFCIFDNVGVGMTNPAYKEARPFVIFWDYGDTEPVFVAIERLIYDENGFTTTKPSVSRTLSFAGILQLILKTFPNTLEDQDNWVSDTTKKFLSAVRGEEYWLLTTRYHYSLVYRSLKTHRKLSSCMAYEDNYYRRRVSNKADARLARHVHPLSAYDGCENLRMGVLSKFHPDSQEFWDARAPFILRMLVEVENGKITRRGRAYGSETAQLIVDEHFGTEKQLGGILRAYIAEDVPASRGDDDARYQRVVAPYFDRHNTYTGMGRDGEQHMLLKADQTGCVSVSHGSGQPQLTRAIYCAQCRREHRGFEQLEIPGGHRVVGAQCIANYLAKKEQAA